MSGGIPIDLGPTSGWADRLAGSEVGAGAGELPPLMARAPLGRRASRAQITTALHLGVSRRVARSA
jgi:hypothetical protein